MIKRNFYIELGKLMYAVAKTDGTIHPNEVRVLKKLIKTELVPDEKETDEFGTDTAFYTEFEFDVYEDMNISASLAYDSFITFVKEHDRYVTKDMRKKALLLAIKTTEAFKGKNKAEKQLLEQLKKDLKLN